VLLFVCLRASVKLKIFPGLIARTLLKGDGDEGKGREGQEGMGRGCHGPDQVWEKIDAYEALHITQRLGNGVPLGATNSVLHTGPTFPYYTLLCTSVRIVFTHPAMRH